ncbi:leucine-rich repeat receptor-like serine/threonine-protein kinase At2g14510 [Carex rostrata]
MATPFSFFFLLLFSLLPSALSQFNISGLLIDCGVNTSYTDDRNLRWVPDSPYITSGESKNLSTPGLYTTFSTLRSFPFNASRPRKFCYTLPSYRGARYLVRTSYFFGGPGVPPVFDLIVDANLWTMVNTTADYVAGSASYHEGVFQAKGKSMNVCLAGNPNYTKGDPFISSLELIMLDYSVYNATDFNTMAMGLIARNKFGATGDIEGYPEDRFHRYWQPFPDKKHAKTSTHNISTSFFWNLPPQDVFNTAIVADKGSPLAFQWPQLVSLQNSTYYVALYFADTVPGKSRNLAVYINGYQFYDGSVTSNGTVVFSSEWSLSGLTTVTLAPGSGSNLPPLINAGEVFGLFKLQNLTTTRDVISLQAIKQLIDNPPEDWTGDPCMPPEYPWTGVTCTFGSRIRVVSLNLANMGLTGKISPSIANLTAIANISLAFNNFSGGIPNLGQLNYLTRLDLQNNQLNGSIPQSLGNITSLRELFLQNNNLTGQVPSNLLNNTKLNLRLHPGNNFSPDPPVP